MVGPGLETVEDCLSCRALGSTVPGFLLNDRAGWAAGTLNGGTPCNSRAAGGPKPYVGG